MRRRSRNGETRGRRWLERWSLSVEAEVGPVGVEVEVSKAGPS